MLLGDSGCPAPALIACLRAEKLPAPTYDLEKVAVHRNICLLQLGLARHAGRGLIPIVEFGEPELTIISHDALNTWLRRQLLPFHGNLDAAADHVVKLVVAAADA